VTGFRKSGETLPVAFIRYNAHAFNIDHRLAHVDLTAREEQVVDLIQNWEFHADFEIQYMYYDAYEIDGHLRCEVWDHKDYDVAMQNFCRVPVID